MNVNKKSTISTKDDTIIKIKAFTVLVFHCSTKLGRFPKLVQERKTTYLIHYCQFVAVHHQQNLVSLLNSCPASIYIKSTRSSIC